MSFEQGISKVEPYSITNILTLRYDPSVTPIFPKKTWQDISPQSFQTVDFFEKLIEKNINHTIETHQTKKISIALSGGVDSTLVLAMIRKMFPDIEINAISIKFADSIDETKRASEIADKFEANHLVLHVENYFQNLPEAISIVKLPFWDLHWFYVVNKAKTTGEPPLMLAMSVFYAIKDAIASVGNYNTIPNIDAPATPERILMSINKIKNKII